jgi:membrane protein implicated in regulation of membrane protease activity
MPWWGWIVIGALLLGAEAFVDSQFYLAIFGAAAVLVGAAGLAGLSGPVWLQWALFGALSIALLVGFRRRLYQRVRSVAAEGYQALVGETATAREPIAAGALGRAELRGALWSARNVGPAPLAAGQRARVARVDGLTLELQGED